MDYFQFRNGILILSILQLVALGATLAFNAGNNPDERWLVGHTFLYIANAVIFLFLLPFLWRAFNTWMHRTPPPVKQSFFETYRQTYSRLYRD